MTTPPFGTENHVDPQQLAAYVERRLAPADRDHIEAHLADCDRCRADAVAALRALPSGRGWWRPVLAVAAAAALLVVLVPVLRRGRAPEPDLLRSGPAATLQLIAPEPGGAGGDSVRFVWRAQEPGTRYRLSVVSDAGDRVTTANTIDTAVTLAAGDIRPPAGGATWFVDATLPGGAVRTSERRSLAPR